MSGRKEGRKEGRFLEKPPLLSLSVHSQREEGAEK